LFGSTARGDASGIDSDVDLLAIVADDGDRLSVADELRDIAYDVMLEFGPVVEVYVPSHREVEAGAGRETRSYETYFEKGGRMPDTDGPTQDEVRKQLRKANRALTDSGSECGTNRAAELAVGSKRE
jgi:hypothetical protein